jgi:chaperonin GroEL
LTKHYSSGSDMNQRILNGANTLADNVASTLGPRGRNVILQEKAKRPIITKDGVTVANFVDLEDPVENAAAQIIKQAAAQTNTDAGDGTTTATVLARSILTEAQRYISAGVPPIDLQRGIERGVEAITKNLQEFARPITCEEDIAHVASISANNDKLIGTLIGKAVAAAGKDGAITVEEARSHQTSLDLVEGFRLDAGYAASAFITDERRRAATYDNPLLLVTDEKIEHVQDIMGVLELAAREARPLIFIATEVEGQALAAMIMNALKGTLKVAAIKAPRYGEERQNILKDLALSTGATFVSRSTGKRLKDVKLIDFGTAGRIDITRFQTTIVGGKGEQRAIDLQIASLKEELIEEDNLHECEKIQDRIARLASGIAIIRVGGATEIEMIEKKHRIEDALEAVQSAQQEGIVPGGGTALLKASRNLKVDVMNTNEQIGVDILVKAVEAPIRQMAINAGISPDIICDQVQAKLKKGNYGYNFVSGKVEDLLEVGVIDPVKVTRTALQNAASVAGTLITTNYSVIQV